MIPSSCRELTGLAKQHSLKHGPHALVEIRNSMVHPNAIVRQYPWTLTTKQSNWVFGTRNSCSLAGSTTAAYTPRG